MAAEAQRVPRVARDRTSAFEAVAPIFATPMAIRSPRLRFVADQGSADAPRVLEIFNQVPGWAIVHAASDNSNAPLIRCGEVVVVESHHGRAGWLPTEGGLFLIEYVSAPLHGERYRRRTCEIVQTFTDKRGRWCAGGLRRGVSTECAFFACDGPYPDDCALADKLIGKVVGIYNPTPIGAAS